MFYVFIVCLYSECRVFFCVFMCLLFICILDCRVGSPTHGGNIAFKKTPNSQVFFCVFICFMCLLCVCRVGSPPRGGIIAFD